MKKVYKNLTDDQIKRGVVFSSCLSVARTEQENDTIHEVLKGQENANETINRLLNDSFFNKSPYNFNIVRQ